MILKEKRQLVRKNIDSIRERLYATSFIEQRFTSDDVVEVVIGSDLGTTTLKVELFLKIDDALDNEILSEKLSSALRFCKLEILKINDKVQ